MVRLQPVEIVALLHPGQDRLTVFRPGVYNMQPFCRASLVEQQTRKAPKSHKEGNHSNVTNMP